MPEDDIEQPGFVEHNTERDELKIFVSRIPTVFDEENIKRVLEDGFGEGTVKHVALAYEKEDEKCETRSDDRFDRPKKKKKVDVKEHRGFGFVTLMNTDLVEKAISTKCIKGGLKPSSTKKYSLYIGPCLTDEQKEGTDPHSQMCFLWTKNRCPYGAKCKFSHDGPGGVLEREAKKPQKCRDYRKGKCKLAEKCPFSHNFEPKICLVVSKRPDSEKDCINWKKRGKCRKRETCPYKHDPAKQKKKQQHKNKQPIAVRVFGLNYETKEQDVRSMFAACGPIVHVDFPTFSDSGRGKGYCGVKFQSPKAVEKAILLDKTELQGRWLSVQAGKMYLEDWEKHHADRRTDEAKA